MAYKCMACFSLKWSIECIVKLILMLAQDQPVAYWLTFFLITKVYFQTLVIYIYKNFTLLSSFIHSMHAGQYW